MLNIPYGRQHITDEDIQAVVQTLKSDWLTQGPAVEAFEKQFAKYVGAPYAVAVSNGTAALHISALALGTRAGSRVITTPITFAASANCIQYCGGQAHFADIDPETLVLDINKVRSLLNAYPRGTFSGIIPVSFAGYPVDTEAFRKLADEYGLWIIEDACHAPGASFTDSKGKAQRTGNGAFADLTVFSFHPVKHIACGEGGMITTNNFELYKKLQGLRSHGVTKDSDYLTRQDGNWYYEMQELGYNYRLTDISCALGLSQLKRAKEGLERRRAIARKYDEAFEGTEIQPIKVPATIEHAYHLYVIQIESRKNLYDYLRTKGIYAQVHYVPVHTMPYYQRLGWKSGDMPVAEHYYQKCLSLPMYPSLTEEEQSLVINHIKNFYYEKACNNSREGRQQKSAA